MDGLHDTGSLGNHTGDGGEAVNVRTMKGLEIRLNTRTCGTIGSGDGEGNGGRGEARVRVGHSFVAYGVDTWIRVWWELSVKLTLYASLCAM